MKIALVTYSLNIGGVESIILNLAKSFYELGHEVTVVETNKAGKWKQYFINEGFKVRTFKVSQLSVPILHIHQIISYLNKFDIIFINDAPYAQAGIGRLRGTIKVFPILHNNIKSMIDNAKSSHGQWNKIICISPKLKEVLDTIIDKENSIFIPNFIINNHFIERNFESTFCLLFVGRIENSQKGVFLLPQIAKELNEMNVPFTLNIIGDGPSMNELRNAIKVMQLENQVKLLGSLPNEEVLRHMNCSHFLIMPSNYEGMPIVLLEAMACGLIPIVSYLDGHTNILITENKTGFFGIPGDSSSFVKKIEFCYRNNKSLHKISKMGFQVIQEEYGKKRTVEKYLQLIQNSEHITARSNLLDLSIIEPLPFLPKFMGRIFMKIEKIFS